MRIGLIGKYVQLADAYLSVVESLKHAGFHHGAKVEVDWIQAEEVEGLLAAGRLADLDGIVIPGGFGARGVEGKIAAARFAREEGVPCLGLCLGLQTMTIEFARNVLGLTDANSTEFDPTTQHPVIDLMNDQRDVTDKGGTMRLGAYYAVLVPGTKVYEAYGEPVVSERHRHRYEFNPNYRARLEAAGFVCCGASPDRRLVEFIELRDHPYWVGDAGPPGVQEPAGPAAPAVPGPRRGGAEAARRAGGAGDAGRAEVAGFRRLDERVVHQAHVWRVVVADFEGPAGETFARTIVRSPGAVGVLPLVWDAEGNPSVVLVEQWRPPYEERILEIPAGMRDVEGEPPEDTARRELVEEAGLDAARVDLLTRAVPVARADRLGDHRLPGDRLPPGRAGAARPRGGARPPRAPAVRGRPGDGARRPDQGRQDRRRDPAHRRPDAGRRPAVRRP